MKRENNTKLRNQRFKERLENNPESLYKIMETWDIKDLETLKKACRYDKNKNDISLIIDHIHYDMPQHIIDISKKFMSNIELFNSLINELSYLDQCNQLINIYNKITGENINILKKISNIRQKCRIIRTVEIVNELLNTIKNNMNDTDIIEICSNNILNNIKLLCYDLNLIIIKEN